jgi:tripeptide aminopeptidase
MSPGLMIRRDRLQTLLLDLVRIDSLSRREGAIAARLERALRALGAEVAYDHAGDAVGGEVGNLVARFPGTTAAPAFLLCAHMDTVEPGLGVKPVVDGDVIRSDGTTVLGGDDKSGIAIILECLTVCRERGLPHPPVDVVFTVCEEAGLLGAKHLDLDLLRARRGLVFDSDAVGVVFTRAPGSHHVEAVIHGRAAHAGMAPEEGVSAIVVAAEAVAAMRLGRIDHETTANLGTIQGGRAINIVPDRVRVVGEARSHDPAKLEAQCAHMRACFEAAARRHPGARVDVRIEPMYAPMSVPDDSSIMRLLRAAARDVGRAVEPAGMGGGCDANVLNHRGLEVVNLGTGMREIHTTHEWLRVSDMVATAEVTLATLQRAAADA